MPEASMSSADSTLTLFWTPETVTFAQWPVISTVFVIPLMLTEPPSQSRVSCRPDPPTSTLLPAVIGAEDEPGVDGTLTTGPVSENVGKLLSMVLIELL